jgi:hypothetical protein
MAEHNPAGVKEPSWIVYGPQGCGKSMHARAIAKMLSLKDVVDDWDGSAASFREHDTLHVTHLEPNFIDSRFCSWDADGLPIIMAPLRTFSFEACKSSLMKRYVIGNDT